MARKRQWSKAGRFSLGKATTFTLGKDGRARDNRTGRLISKANLARRKPGAVSVQVERTLKNRVYQGRVVATEWTYRLKIPKGIAPADKKRAVDVLAEAMRERGIKTLPIRKGLAQAKFYVYVEGEARDLRTKRKFRGVTGIAHRRKMQDVSIEAKDKITALIEGGTLGTSSITGSGAQTMKAGPDTVYFVASYGVDTKVPGLDYSIPKKRKGKRK